MKILFTSDWHVDATTAGVPRFDEATAYVDELVRACGVHAVDIVCFLGDAFDPGSMLEGCWSAFMVEAQYRLTRASSMGSVFITGNHDVIDASVPMSTLSPLARIAELYNGIAIGEDWRSTAVAEVPMLVDVFGGAVAILALPYVSRGAARTARVSNAYETAFAAAAAAKARGTRIVAIGHYSLPGITPGSEEEMMRGRELPFPADAIRELGPDLVVNGHYHARQTVDVGGVQVEVVGAPTRFTFGEKADGERGFLIAEV